jgi:hypothetical protein
MSYLTWGEVALLASKAGAKYPELCAAQWALESGWGKSVSGKNNFFGIKGRGTVVNTTEFIGGKKIYIADEFMDFATVYDCVKYIVDKWYKDFNGYKGVNNATNRDEAAKMLVKCGYATDPNYATKLIDLMNRNSIKQDAAPHLPEIVDLANAARWYSGKPHQIQAWNKLQSLLTTEQLMEFTANYRGIANKIVSNKFPLNVPYYYQLDSKTGHGERSCQSSALAMVIKYLNPKLINNDDDYLNLVFKYGDTVSQLAHQKALTELGLIAKFSMNGAEKDLIRILDMGYPVPIGILHKGSIQNPSGGGHWVTLIGYDKEYFYVHDPFGKLDLVNGNYQMAGPTDGRQQKYSRANLMKRWLINNNSDGWYWDFTANKKQ